MHSGILSAALAHLLWGLFPLYFRPLAAIAPLDVVAHRIFWSAVFVLLVLVVRRQWAWLGEVARRPALAAAFAASAVLLSGNWLTYVWAVTNGHVLDASLGYFITPLVNVLLGRTLLHERLRPIQWTAVALAAAGVAWLALRTGELPWIALVLGCTFGVYGLLRKTAFLGALEGLALETMVLVLPALAWIVRAAWQGGGGLFPPAAGNGLTRALLVGLGPVTALPLLLFAAGARRVRLATLGLLQYLGPSMQFVLGVTLFHEPLDAGRLAGFGMIWGALALYSADALHAARPRATAGSVA